MRSVVPCANAAGVDVETVLVPTEVATFSTSVLEVQMVLPIMNCVPGGSAVTAPVEKIWVVLPAVPALVTVPSSVPWLTAEIPYSGERTLVSFTGLLFGGIGSPVVVVTFACPTYTVFRPLL
jgi:hypothetical protein